MSTKIYANARFGFREDTLKNWTEINPILEKGEPAVVRDGANGEWLKIGDGVTAFNNLPWKTGPKGEKGEQGTQGIKGDKGEQGIQGVAGKDAVTDQTYDPNSPNAQSGVAVAEAIGKASEAWEKITDTTLTEQAVVNIAKDGEGNLLALKKFKILVEMPKVTSATTLWLKINNILAMFTQPSSASGTPVYSINGEYTYDWQLSTCTHSANAFNSSPIYTTPYGHRYAAGSIPFPCTSIGLALNFAFTQGLPEGARIRIWGVKE